MINKGKIERIFLPVLGGLFVVSLFGLIYFDQQNKEEITNLEYSYILGVAKTCDRDKCDEIKDSMMDGFVSGYESYSILLFENFEDEPIEDAKEILGKMVENDGKFRPKS